MGNTSKSVFLIYEESLDWYAMVREIKSFKKDALVSELVKGFRK